MTNDISLNLDDLTEIKVIGNVRQGDFVIADGWILPVTNVIRKGKTIEIWAEHLSNPTGVRFFHSKHRASTPVAKAVWYRIYRKAVGL